MKKSILDNHCERIRSLDGLRGFAVIMVVLFHSNYLPDIDKLSIFPKLLNEILKMGWAGVDLSFVLSGF